MGRGRPKKDKLENEILQLEAQEKLIINKLSNLDLYTIRGAYIRDVINILFTLNKPISEITEELMIHFGDLIKEYITDDNS